MSLSAIVDDEEHHRDTQKCIDTFIRDTGWNPDHAVPVAGAIRYSQYDFFRKTVIRMIAKKEGYATSTDQDYEYTDWPRLREVVNQFLARVV